MAQSADHYKKYQVYFFLYLAVICELLIIIVERDDAEADLLAFHISAGLQGAGGLIDLKG